MGRSETMPIVGGEVQLGMRNVRLLMKLGKPVRVASVSIALRGTQDLLGEPMLQAAGLSSMLRAVRASRDVDVLCFSGYRLEQLHQSPPGPGT